METIGYLFRYAIAILLMIPMYSLAILISIFNKPISWQIIVAWDRLFLKIFGVDVTLEFENPDIKETPGGVIVGLNQGSLLDPMIGRSVSITIYKSIYNIEFAMIPFIGWIAWIFGWVIVRQIPSQAKKKLKKAESYARKGGFVYISMEGKRSKDGKLSQYKKGPVVLAINSKTKIIPAVVRGSSDCLPYGEWKIRPGKVVAKVLKEIPTDNLGYEDRDSIVEKLLKIAEKENLSSN